MAEDEMTLDDILKIITDPDFDLTAMKTLVKEEFDVELSEEVIADNDLLAKEIFNLFQRKSSEVKAERAKSRTRKTRQRKTSGGVSRSAFIEGFIREKGKTTRKEIEQATDEAFHYSEAGKTPRTRVARCIRNLKEKSLITDQGGSVEWVGSKDA